MNSLRILAEMVWIRSVGSQHRPRTLLEDRLQNSTSSWDPGLSSELDQLQEPDPTLRRWRKCSGSDEETYSEAQNLSEVEINSN